MTDTALSATIATDNHECLYRTWRRANALWELARCADEVPIGDDLPDEIDGAHCDATHAALMAPMIHPAKDISELSRKLRIARDEDVHRLTDAGEIIAALAADAHRLAIDAMMQKNRQRPIAA